MAPSRTSRTKSATPLENVATSLVNREAVTSASTSAVAISKVASSGATPSKDLVDIFKADLDNIKTLVTCTICDQLLYEPWMLACGHTYCYSCLCNWFLPNKRSKSCPDCRSSVKAMPAPAFVIKQLAEIFVNRIELMPADESSEQHIRRRKEENDVVEADRSSQDGLFKGCFSKTPLGNIRYDEAERMHVCSHCGHEFTGGPLCENCGVDFEGEDEDIRDDFSDLEEMEFDLDEDEDEDADEDEDEDDENDMDPRAGLDWFDPFDGAVRIENIRDLLGEHDFHHHHPHPHYHHFHHHLDHHVDFEAQHSRTEGISSDESEEESDGDETTSSMMDFIEPDDSSPAVGRRSRPQIIDSDSDDSDDEDPVSIERPRQHARRQANRPIVLDSDSEAEGSTSVNSENTQSESRAETGLDVRYGAGFEESVRRGGWSPLVQGDDSENDEAEPFAASNDNSDSSDSDTTVGRHDSDNEEDGVARDNVPPVPRPPTEPESPRCQFHRRGGPWAEMQRKRKSIGAQCSTGECAEEREDPNRERERGMSSAVDEYNTSDDDEAATDQDGDVEMSLSPTAAAARGDGEPPVHSGSTNSVQPGSRRTRRQRAAPVQLSPMQEYDPRISMIFAQHQSNLRDATARESPFYEQQIGMPRRIEASSGSRRRAQYRLDQPILGNPFARNREPIIISSPVGRERTRRNRRDYRA